MKTLVSSEAIQYIYDSYVTQCLAKKLPVQEKLTAKQQADIFGVIKSASNAVFGRRLYPTIFHQVAFILYTLNKRHILVDGNKRFSLMLALYILQEQGVEHTKMTADDWEMLVIRIAADTNCSIAKAVQFLNKKLS